VPATTVTPAALAALLADGYQRMSSHERMQFWAQLATDEATSKTPDYHKAQFYAVMASVYGGSTIPSL
jgi:hypothetical protein